MKTTLPGILLQGSRNTGVGWRTGPWGQFVYKTGGVTTYLGLIDDPTLGNKTYGLDDADCSVFLICIFKTSPHVPFFKTAFYSTNLSNFSYHPTGDTCHPQATEP